MSSSLSIRLLLAFFPLLVMSCWKSVGFSEAEKWHIETVRLYDYHLTFEENGGTSLQGHKTGDQPPYLRHTGCAGTLEVSGDGILTLNDRTYGKIKEGQLVEITRFGKVLVDQQERLPQSTEE